MPETIHENDIPKYGVYTNHEQMDNGELRFRMLSNDGSSYIRGENRQQFVWGNSHSHKDLHEFIIVQQGFVVFAEMEEGGVSFRQLQAGDIFVSRRGVPHNHCFDENTVVHTIKFGGEVLNDWIACPALDALTKHLTQREVMEKVNSVK